eukprot:2972593-Rhodomonas_salina.2
MDTAKSTLLCRTWHALRNQRQPTAFRGQTVRQRWVLAFDFAVRTPFPCRVAYVTCRNQTRQVPL